MRKRRRARRRRAPKSQHYLRGMLRAWRERLSGMILPGAKREPTRYLPGGKTDLPSPISVVHINLQEKWQQLKQEKENSTKQASPQSRFVSFRRKGRKWVFCSGCILLVLSALVCAVQYLRHVSKQRESDLTAAVRSADWVLVHQKLALANVSVYHFFNPHLQSSVGNAESWILRQKELHAQLKQKIANMESGKIPLDSLSIHAVAEIERALRTLPSNINNLSSRWASLHAKNAELFSKNKNYVMEQLLTPPKISDFLTLNETEDIAILHAKMEEWSDFLETCRAYAIPAHLKTRGETYLEELRKYHTEAQALQSFKRNIKEAVTYNEYITQAKNKKAEKYSPAIKLFGLLQAVPTLEQWRKKMYPIHHLIPEDKSEMAKGMLLRGDATYNKAFPVSQELYAIANELFAAQSLHQRFYQIFHTDGRVHISDEFPQSNNENPDRVFFTLSVLDPAFSSTSSKDVSWETHNVKVRSVSCAALMQACKINREDLFLRANFPRLLEQILSIKDAGCPVLAKAFVFQRLLQLLQGHPFFSLHLERFAPSLSADATSFGQLCQKHASVLHSGAWLLPGAQVSAAEKDFARWFKVHYNRDYHVEIVGTAAPLFTANPRYVGAADETGKPMLLISLSPNTVIWYMGQDGIRASAPGKLPEDAVPYSPLLINSNLG